MKQKTMLVSNLSKTIAESIEREKILEKIRKGKYTILESDTRESTHLKRVDVLNIPYDNVWAFQSEIQDIDCLRNQNSTVERTILYLNDGKFYAYMIELKSGLSKKNIESLKKKFTCSLVALTLYLSSHPDFSSLTDVEILPVGIACFNENTYQRDYDSRRPHYSALQETVYKFNPQKDFHKTTVQIKPVTLNRTRIPVLFFQNPNYISGKDTNEFPIDFKRFSV